MEDKTHKRDFTPHRTDKGGASRISASMWLFQRALLISALSSKSLTRAMCAQASDWQSAKSIYDFSAKDIDGEEVSLEKYRGYVCIITNVASK